MASNREDARLAMRTQVPETARPVELDAVSVEYGQRGRVVKCFCGERVTRSIVPHLKTRHPAHWHHWIQTFIELRATGYPLKRIMRLFRAGDGHLLFSWTVIERAIRREVETGETLYVAPRKKRVERWKPDDFVLETTTVWDFPRRGDWAVHIGDYRGNWPPQIPRNLIERYTQVGDLVVDAFAGGGTTLVEAWLLGRRSIGFDISRLAIQTTKARLKEMEDLAEKSGSISLDPACRPIVIEGDALQLSSALGAHGVGKGDVKLVCAHPPYLDSLEYTVNNCNDLALLSDPDAFCDRMRVFAREVQEVLSEKGVCAVLIGDVRKRGKTVPLGFSTLGVFLKEEFELDSVVMKTQHRDRSSEFYVRRASALLMAHEYLFILRGRQT